MRVGLNGVALLGVGACLLLCAACRDTPQTDDAPHPAVPTEQPAAPAASSAPIAQPPPAAASRAAEPEGAATTNPPLAAARKRFIEASSPAARTMAVAEIAGSDDENRFEALLDIASGAHEPEVREAAVLALGTPAAAAQAGRLREVLRELREPALRLAAQLALVRIADRPLEQPEAFQLSASFEPAPAGAPVLRVRAAVRATQPGGPVRAQVGLIGSGRVAGPTDRWVAPLEVSEERALVVDLELSGDGPHTVELTASGKDVQGDRCSTSRRWRVAFRDGEVEVTPEADQGGTTPGERLR